MVPFHLLLTSVLSFLCFAVVAFTKEKTRERPLCCWVDISSYTSCSSKCIQIHLFIHYYSVFLPRSHGCHGLLSKFSAFAAMPKAIKHTFCNRTKKIKEIPLSLFLLNISLMFLLPRGADVFHLTSTSLSLFPQFHCWHWAFEGNKTTALICGNNIWF